MTRDEVCAKLKELDVPHAILANVPDLLESEQAWENKFLTKFTLHSGQEVIEAETPLKFGGVTDVPRKNAPYLGEQTLEVLEELGYEKAAIDSLIEQGIAIHTDAESANA